MSFSNPRVPKRENKLTRVAYIIDYEQRTGAVYHEAHQPAPSLATLAHGPGQMSRHPRHRRILASFLTMQASAAKTVAFWWGTMHSLLRIERPLLVLCALGLATLIVWWTSLTYSAWSKQGVSQQVSRSFSEQVSEPDAEVDPLLPTDARWRAVVQAIAGDRAVLARCRIDLDRCPEAARRLLEIIETARGKDGRARIGEVNRALNLSIAYTSDRVQHGLDDVWTPPLLTLASGRGDCEDYALAKYLALLELGFEPADLRIMIVETRLRRQHAILATRLGRQWLMLDNAHSLVLEERVLPYRVTATFGGDDDPARRAARIRINIAAM